MPISPQPDGSKIVPAIFLWLAYFLQDDFLPFEWQLRNDAGHMQRNLGGDCGVYTVTTAMSLAFGYHLGAFPEGHQARALFRRRTYVQDLMLEGFEFWNKDPNNPNWQYYPLLDTKPTASKNEKFFELPKQLIDELPHHVAIRKKCYVECPNKSLLKVHCKRNMRFYPGYEAAKVSGPLTTLREFRQLSFIVCRGTRNLDNCRLSFVRQGVISTNIDKYCITYKTNIYTNTDKFVLPFNKK